MFIAVRQSLFFQSLWFGVLAILLRLSIPNTGSALMDSPSPWLRELCNL